MIRVGLTGGIGSGKSIVSSVFETLGVPVFHADNEAKNLYLFPEVKASIIREFGNTVFSADGEVDRIKLAARIFSDTESLKKLNALIHPLVKKQFEVWCGKHSGHTYIVHEAAILFETGFDQYFDQIIVVSAPLELCIHRVMLRDHTSREEVLQRMSHQWDLSRKEALADYILVNDGSKVLLPGILEIHDKLRNA
jgi:dephospho-CoA kinase